jgi:FHA domain/Bacterial regulatory protein, Fis family
MLRLLVLHGHEEQVFALPEGEARLGRAPENDFVVRAPGVSRRHALVRRTSGGVEVVDLSSKNGLLVEGRRVRSTILTPGLRLQIGAAWLEVEEVSSSSAKELAHMVPYSSERSAPILPTGTAAPGGGPQGRLPADEALTLAYHIAQAGAGLPGKRDDLFLRIQATLGAKAFASFERTRRGRLRTCENVGEFHSDEIEILASIAADARAADHEQVVLRRAGRLLLAGRDAWFLGVSFAEESLAQEGWRKDFLRFLAHQLFAPVRSLDELSSSEASRVLALARGNKRRTAALLGISPGTLYKLLTSKRRAE